MNTPEQHLATAPTEASRSFGLPPAAAAALGGAGALLGAGGWLYFPAMRPWPLVAGALVSAAYCAFLSWRARLTGSQLAGRIALCVVGAAAGVAVLWTMDLLAAAVVRGLFAADG
jgi:hypothetical protein